LEEKHIEILKSVGIKGITEKNIGDSGYWLDRANKFQAIATQNRAVYNVLDHTRGEGVITYDIEGNEYLDLASGVAVRALGTRYKPYLEFEASIVDTVHEIMSNNWDSIPQIGFAERLVEITPGKFDKQASLTTSGARAVENCMKSAMDKTGRRRFVGFRPAFHGRTGYALALTASNAKHKAGFPQGVDVTRVFYPYCYRCPYGQNVEDCNVECAEALRQAISLEGDDIAATVMESICAEGGFYVPPAKAVKAIYEITKEVGGYFVADEVQSGMGRTGKWWAIENFDVIPDYIAIGKAVGAGYPMGAVVGPHPLFSGTSRHSETFGAEPKMALTSLWVLKHLEDERFLKKNEEDGAYMIKRLEELKDTHEVIGDVRGIGLMAGVEFVKNKKSKERDQELRNAVVETTVRKYKLWTLAAGHNVIRWLPSYVITREQIDDAIDRFDKAISDCTK
jgi:4-aminobutyrate aminotransferase-like enzyme